MLDRCPAHGSYWVERKVFAFFKWKVNHFFKYIYTIFNQLYNLHCLLLPSPYVSQAFQFRACKNFLVLIQNMLGQHIWPLRIFQISCYLNGFTMIWINDNRMVPSPVNMAGGQKFPNLVRLFFAASFYWHGVVLMKENSFSVDEIWTIFLTAFVYSVQLLTVTSEFMVLLGRRSSYKSLPYPTGHRSSLSPGLHHCLFRITLS
jgi:hypothetical protein